MDEDDMDKETLTKGIQLKNELDGIIKLLSCLSEPTARISISASGSSGDGFTFTKERFALLHDTTVQMLQAKADEIENEILEL